MIFEHLIKELFLEVGSVNELAFRGLFAIEGLQSLSILATTILNRTQVTNE